MAPSRRPLDGSSHVTFTPSMLGTSNLALQFGAPAMFFSLPVLVCLLLPFPGPWCSLPLVAAAALPKLVHAPLIGSSLVGIRRGVSPVGLSLD